MQELIVIWTRKYFSADITLRIKSKFKTIDKDGIKYYAVDTFSSKILIGDGNIRLQSSDPDNEGDGRIIKLCFFFKNFNVKNIFYSQSDRKFL